MAWRELVGGSLLRARASWVYHNCVGYSVLAPLFYVVGKPNSVYVHLCPLNDFRNLVGF